MTDALAVPCPDCRAPAGTDCYTSVAALAGNTHAERERVAVLRSLEQGHCDLCGQIMVLSVDGTEAWHPGEAAAAACPPLPDPALDWNTYALAIQDGLAPGRPGVEHYVPGIPADAIAAALREPVEQPLARVGVLVSVCPECRDGKHGNCTKHVPHPLVDDTWLLCPCECQLGVTTP